MTSVEFWRQGDWDAWNEYQEIKAADPAMGRAIRDAITLVAKDPDIAQRNYSRSLDPRAGYLGLPFQSPNGLITCLTWRQHPDGYNSVMIIDFTEPWDDLPMPRVWPRPE